MSCNYCENKAKYKFQGGERVCQECLIKLPRTVAAANLMIVELQKENRKLEMIIKEGLGPEDLKRDF